MTLSRFVSFERNADLYVHTTPLYPVSMQGGRGLVKVNGGISHADAPSISRSTKLIVVETRESRVVTLTLFPNLKIKAGKRRAITLTKKIIAL